VIRLGIVSDIHYASAAEQARGNDYEFRGLKNPLLRTMLHFHRRFVWLHRPFDHNHLLDAFIRRAKDCDYVVANGDYSCDSAFCGLSDEASFQSANECLGKLNDAFGAKFFATFGDHELGKISFMGGRGGMRLENWRRATEELKMRPFWRLDAGSYVVLGVVSSLVALPVFEPDTSPAERKEWEALRADHLNQIRTAFESIKPNQRIILFAHDPTSLPFLYFEPAVQSRLGQIEQTIIGHLHSKLILWKGKLLAGMPRITFLGHTAKRMTTALRDAKYWRPFHVRLCPSLAGIELLKDGGYLTAELDENAVQPARFKFHPLPRKPEANT
jgi:hypothetical protein